MGAKNDKFNINGRTHVHVGGTTGPSLQTLIEFSTNVRVRTRVFTRVSKRKHDPPPRGFEPPATYRSRFRPVDWARQEKVQKAWAEPTAEHSLAAGRLQEMDIDRTFSFTDGSLMGSALDLTMSKAKKLGRHGFVDSNDAIREVLGEFTDLKMLPPMLN
ncbi:catalytic [Ascochyta rabiei]|uniref:Catalytic n=1 Tax=Didymella rabiei TaxID=5454 RepID=A0A162ZBV2_DIDRA|nr:catalytic [Ascochyta rabiei]